ncbi:hypothetical protein L6259_01540 [Candidatus Parcubacteria bacterium]|nr:hypothetical protein [Candidatus Parcubacteria bacterium]
MANNRSSFQYNHNPKGDKMTVIVGILTIASCVFFGKMRLGASLTCLALATTTGVLLS